MIDRLRNPNRAVTEHACHRFITRYTELRDGVADPMDLDSQLRIKWALAPNAPIDYETFLPEFKRIVDLFDDPRALRDKARNYLLSGIPKGTLIDQQEINVLAAYACFGPYYKYTSLMRNGGLDIEFRTPGEAGTLFRIDGSSYEILKGNRPRPFFSEPPISLPMRIAHLWNRNESRYPHVDGLSASERINRRLELGDERIHILDIGRGDACFLHGLKKTFDNQIYTAGITIDNWRVSERPIDDDHIGLAEILPDRWNNSFDLVYSNMAFMYFLFPAKALQGVARVLKSGGEAHLQAINYYNPEIGENEFMEKLGYPDGFLSEVTKDSLRMFRSGDTIQQLLDSLSPIGIRGNVDSYGSRFIVHMYKQ